MSQYQYPTPAGPGTPTGSEGFFESLRRSGMVRTDERWIGGVAGGLARRFGWDPLLVRALFIVAAMVGGVGLVAYGIAWALLPEERDGRIHLQQLFHGDVDIAVLGAIAMAVVGLGGSAWSPAGWWGDGLGWVTWLALAGAGIAVLVTLANRDSRPPLYPPTTPPGAPAPGFTPGAPVPTSPPAQPPATPQPTYPSAPVYPGRSTASAGPATAYPGPATAYPGQAGSYPGPATAYPTMYPPAGRPPVGPTPPPASVPRGPSGPGAGATSAIVGVGLIIFALVWIADRTSSYDGPVFLTAGAIALIVAGLAVVLAGIRGRTAGGIGGLAIVAMVLLLPAAAVHSWSGDFPTGKGIAVGELIKAPTTAAEAEDGFFIGAGEADIDLTELPVTRGGITVPIGVGAGDIQVVLPEDGDWIAEVHVMAGEITLNGDVLRSGAGMSDPLRVESRSVQDGAEPTLTVEIGVGAGQVDLKEVGR